MLSIYLYSVYFKLEGQVQLSFVIPIKNKSSKSSAKFRSKSYDYFFMLKNF